MSWVRYRTPQYASVAFSALPKTLLSFLQDSMLHALIDWLLLLRVLWHLKWQTIHSLSIGKIKLFYWAIYHSRSPTSSQEDLKPRSIAAQYNSTFSNMPWAPFSNSSTASGAIRICQFYRPVHDHDVPILSPLRSTPYLTWSLPLVCSPLNCYGYEHLGSM